MNIAQYRSYSFTVNMNLTLPMNENNANSEYSPSTSPHDDESVFTEEENGVRRCIKPGELVRACGVFETIAAKVSKYKHLNTVMPVWLQTKKPISSEDVLEALWIVSRQVSTLQLCLSKLGKQYWFKRMVDLKIDFETTEKNEIDVLHELLDTSFDLLNGPLWKVRLTTAKENVVDKESLSYIMVFAIFHIINDGVTNMKIAREFVAVMNKIATRTEIVLTFSPIVVPIDNIARSMASMPFLITKVAGELYSKLFRNFSQETSFSGRIPFPKSRKAATKVLFDNLSEEETELIGKMCKNAKISINTFVITVANLALMTVANGKSAKPLGTRKITLAQNVNLRRHFDEKFNDAPGYHIALMEDTCKVSIADDFWTVAKMNHFKFKDSLENKKEYLKIIPICHLGRTMLPINNFLTRNGIKNKTLAHYVTSNMGNLKSYLPDPKEEDSVKITYLIRSCSLQLSGALFLLNFQSLNGKLLFSLDYYTNQMKDETAKELFTEFFKVLRDMIESHESGIQTLSET